MSIPDYQWRKGDTEPIFSQRLTWRDGSTVNLTGATLSLIMRSAADAAPLELTGEVSSPTPSHIEYRPSAGDARAVSAGRYFGNWLVVFADGTPQSFPTDGFLLIQVEESLSGPVITIGARPGVSEVALHVKARTKVLGGKTLGTFTDATPVTAGEVQAFIDDAMDEVLGKVVPIDPGQAPGSAYNAPGSDYERRIRRAVALYAAILVELSLFPEQVRAGQSPAAILQQLYDSRIRALIAEGETGRAQGEGSGTPGGGDSPADAAWSFPDAMPGAMVGWQSRW